MLGLGVFDMSFCRLIILCETAKGVRASAASDGYRGKDGQLIERFTGLSSKIAYTNAINEGLK